MRARLEKNSHLLQPPINNYCVYNDDVTVMVRLPLVRVRGGRQCPLGAALLISSP